MDEAGPQLNVRFHQLGERQILPGGLPIDVHIALPADVDVNEVGKEFYFVTNRRYVLNCEGEWHGLREVRPY